jgi:alpha-glucoside transport system substrate-binding protein
MTKRRFFLLALLVALLALAVAACGGDDDDEGGEAGGDTTAATTEEEGGVNEDVSGNISILALWTAGEQASFEAVIEGFNEQYPNVTVTYRSAPDVRPVLSTAIEGGNPPDLAAVPNPGLMRDFQARGALKPIEFARDTIEENYSESWVELASVENELYGLFFKGGNKSTIWYNVHAFEEAGVEPPETWDELLEAAETLKASGIPAYSIGGSDGWVLTDLFENIYLRSAGPEMYDQLAAHEIPWTDQSVKDALAIMAEVVGDPENLAGGTEGSLQTEMPDSVAKVFTDSPDAAMVIIGDFAPGVTETTLEPETGYNVFTFPSIEGSGPSVVGGGDLFVQFNDSPAADAFLEYLTTPEAAEIWAARGGFSSPNQNIDLDVYPDEITRVTAGALAEAESFRFDMSDLQPSAFGGTPGAGLFKHFTDFVANPDDIDGITAKMEADAAKAFG